MLSMQDESDFLVDLVVFAADKRSTARVTLAQAQEIGAIQLKTSAYVLPDAPAHNEACMAGPGRFAMRAGRRR